MDEDMQKLRTQLKVMNTVIILQPLTVVLIIWLMLEKMQSGRQVPSVSQEANPQITTNVQAPDEIGRIEKMAEERGYYYKDEFATKHGVSEKTVDRWRDDGLPSGTNDNGRVVIPWGTPGR